MMEELVQRYLSDRISRRDFVRQLTALGFTMAAAQTVLAQLEPTTPVGQGKGVIAGRVAWVRNPAAATWDGVTGHWWDDTSTSQTVVDKMVSRSVQALTDQRSDKQAWDAIFRNFNETHGFGREGYRRGEKIAIKLNCNQDQSPDWGIAGGMMPGAPPSGATPAGGAPSGAGPQAGGAPPAAGRQGGGAPAAPAEPANGLPSPHVVLAVVTQLIRVAGVPAEDVVIYDVANGRTIGEPIFRKFKGEKASPDLRAVNFVTNDDHGLVGRVRVILDDKTEVHFSGTKDPMTAYLAQQVTGTKYMINLATLRPHSLAGVTLQGKNHFGSIHFPKNGGWTPAPLHSYVSMKNPMGTYNALVDLMGHRHLGGKTVLFMLDGLYAAEWQNGRVFRFESMGDAWASSLLLSQDPVALDSVGVDILKAEPRATRVQGNADNYLHEAALANNPPSGTLYDPNGTGKPLASLGVHEHWNNPKEKKYSRNLGKKDGIELVAELG
jgi:hypothetical protein